MPSIARGELPDRGVRQLPRCELRAAPYQRARQRESFSVKGEHPEAHPPLAPGRTWGRCLAEREVGDDREGEDREPDELPDKWVSEQGIHIDHRAGHDAHEHHAADVYEEDEVVEADRSQAPAEGRRLQNWRGAHWLTIVLRGVSR